MRIWIRLATLCLSLVLLGGVMLHDVASANMSFDMANRDMTAAVAADDNCPACTSDKTTKVACDLDCTAPVLLAVSTPTSAVKAVRRSGLISVAALSLEGLDLGVDPTPPRSTLLI
ncbi:hypothetical protein [Loktanella sp. M215]|uniref:hypothetical protein n=1 Tax=Loktanella sp. M215 TaxID=2675431 RepID=UPI001F43811E|nr:hypothetical protein [Loktanella sp. M215]MCF7702043.1 hypothetical protein [Loktanella sp. M215]